MEIKIKKLHEGAVIPTYAHATDAGMDLVAVTMKHDSDGNIVYGSGLAFEIPEGYVGLLFPRSSNAKKQLLLSNCVGVIDSGYRGEVMCKFKKLSHFCTTDQCYSVGERFAQIIILPYPKVTFVLADDLADSDRGNGGYGSTGK